MSDKKMKKFDYFSSQSGLGRGGIYARATSRSQFCAKTGAQHDYVSFCTDPKMRALCDEAGDDRYVVVSPRDMSHEFRPSKLWLEQEAVRTVRARMGGNMPTITHEKGEESGRYVVIDGERRGRWARWGTRWRLEDTTGKDVVIRQHWSLGPDGLRSNDNRTALWCALYVWEESVALANALQAWEEDQLPPLAEQKRRAAARETAKGAGEVRKKFGARAAENADALIDLLRRVAAGEGDEAEKAAELLGRLGHSEKGADGGMKG